MRQRRSSGAMVGLESSRGDPSVRVDIRGSCESNPNIDKVMISSNTLPDPADTSRIIEASSYSYQQHYRRFYVIHSALVLAVLIVGIIHNGGDRKYIPVNAKDLSSCLVSSSRQTYASPNSSDFLGSTCRKAYVNVHSTSIEEDFAAICCSADSSSADYFNSDKTQQYHAHLCHPRIPIVGISSHQLPYAKRLTRLMEAWILPLLPIIIRLMHQLVMFIWSFLSRKRYWGSKGFGDNPDQQEASALLANNKPQAASLSSSSLSSNTSAALLEKNVADSYSTMLEQQRHLSNHKLIRTTLQRLLFYFLLLNFRGWGLYIGANALEDYVIVPWFTGNTVVSPLRTNSMSDVEHDLHYIGKKQQPECWYKDVLKSHHKSTMENEGHSDCYGRPFDFSDHVVLFLAHYLPIFVMEMLLCYSFPFWDAPAVVAEKATMKQSRSRYILFSRGMIWNACHVFLFLYLHLIVLHALYHTAVYFHTSGEILVGYGVSLILQLPIVYLMCTDEPHWARRYLGLPSRAEVVNTNKGD